MPTLVVDYAPRGRVSPRDVLLVAVVLVLGIGLIAAAGISINDYSGRGRDTSPALRPAMVATPRSQTTYVDTTCSEWNTTTNRERVLAAQWLLATLGRVDNPGAPDPDTATVASFALAIDIACQSSAAGSQDMGSVASILYALERSFAP